MEVLADGSLLIIFRVDCGDGTHGGAFKPREPERMFPSRVAGRPRERVLRYVQTRSTDGGKTWSETASVPGAPGCAFPKLLRLASGPLLLSGGRSIFAGTDDNDVWVSWAGDGASWERHAVSAAHNALAPAGMPRYNTSRVNSSDFGQRQTSSYTTLVPVGDDAALLGYDLWDSPDHEGENHGFVMRLTLQ